MGYIQHYDNGAVTKDDSTRHTKRKCFHTLLDQVIVQKWWYYIYICIYIYNTIISLISNLRVTSFWSIDANKSFRSESTFSESGNVSGAFYIQASVYIYIYILKQSFYATKIYKRNEESTQL